MMRFFTIIASLALLLIVANAAPPHSVDSHIRGPCLQHSDAEKIVERYKAILSHASSDLGDANATAYTLLDDGYTEISDSILSLEGLPLGAVTFSNKAHYIAGVLNGPAATGLNTISVMVAGCTNVLWYWKFSGVGSAAYEVKGFNLFAVTPAMQIKTAYVEFNNVAWGLNTGFTFTRPSSASA